MEALTPGMYVRLPVPEADGQEWYEDSRSFRLGKIQAIDGLESTLVASIYRYPLGAPFAQENRKVSIEQVFRCGIAPGSQFIHQATGKMGTVLANADDVSQPGQPTQYYVAVDGTITASSEVDLIVPADAQDPDPRQQMLRYELQEPGWRALRDPVIGAIADLRNATYGLEELVGSRVLLLPHQAEVITRALAAHVCRFVLADEVGLGKTIEAAVILKGLLRRHPGMRPLVVAPASLTHQWQKELNSKFWMELTLLDQDNQCADDDSGVIVSAEDLSSCAVIRDLVQQNRWGCVIIDEAHHVRKSSELKLLLMELSGRAQAALIVSATPIEQRAGEYLELLRLMDPHHYSHLHEQSFQQLLDAQAEIRSSIEYIRPTLALSYFVSDEFIDELQTLSSLLPQDAWLARAREAAEIGKAVSLEQALDVVAHVNTNYRVEDRVLRNRRAHLESELPLRVLDDTWSYQPSGYEEDALEAILDYCEYVLDRNDSSVVLEYARLLIHAASSSPEAIETLLLQRAAIDDKAPLTATSAANDLLTVRGQRDEPARISSIIEALPVDRAEKDQIRNVLSTVQQWRSSVETERQSATLRSLGTQTSGASRLISVLQAIHKLTQQTRRDSSGKVIVFSSWPSTLNVLANELTRIYGPRSFAEFRAGMGEADLERSADIFQTDRSCQILLTDELGGEGRNFQVADGIVHVDLPWSPARIEQRIGRVDRLGRKGEVVSIVPYARGTVEQDLFMIWNTVFQLFNQSMSGLEIALEGVQTDLVGALSTSVRHGLNQLIPRLTDRISEIRQQVEEERYFEEGSINQRQRAEFRHIREKYRDGKIFEKSVLAWAERAGLKPDSDPTTGITSFSPKHFNPNSMENANILTLPDMDEAIRRAGRRFTQSIRGTFSRDLAIHREDLVFFAPGDDPWFDWIVQNAERADRGRSCAVFRRSPHVTRSWKGLEVLYRIEVDPRPLYRIGAKMEHLVKAQGYLHFPTYRLYISESGEVLSNTSEFARATAAPYAKGAAKDVHLGRRSGTRSALSQFKETYPLDIWKNLVNNLFLMADDAIADEFSFMEDLGEDAREELEGGLRIANAVRSWQEGHLGLHQDGESNAADQAIIDALVEGISRPRIRLESACYWWITKA